MLYATPRLPRTLLHQLTVVKRTFVHDPDNGGQSRPVEEITNVFWGIVLPLSNKDWRQLPEGSFTHNSQKLYTDDPIQIEPGELIIDTYDNQKYTVLTELSHNTIHPMHRYIVEGVVRK